MRRLAYVLCLALAACRPRSDPHYGQFDAPDSAPVGADAEPDATPCERACANLARLACAEATTACVPTCDDELAVGLGTMDPLCALRARDRSDMQRCGPRLCQ